MKKGYVLKGIAALMIAAFAGTLYASGTVWSEVKESVAYVHHDDADFNCCPDMVYEIKENVASVAIYEKDQCTNPCDCDCVFDLTHKLEGLEPGTYTANVWEASCNDNYTLAGTTEFVIPEKLAKVANSSLMSECGGWPGIEEPITSSASPIILGDVTISYEISVASDVSLIIYDTAGRKVRTIYVRSQSTGRHELRWDTRDQEGSRVPKGVYFVMLFANGGARSLPLVVLR